MSNVSDAVINGHLQDPGEAQSFPSAPLDASMILFTMEGVARLTIALCSKRASGVIGGSDFVAKKA